MDKSVSPEGSMSPEEIDRLYMQGDRCFHQGEFITAVDKLESLLQIIEPGDRLYQVSSQCSAYTRRVVAM